jgi:addiction module RelB/DinJ family antitoxin
MSKTSLLTIRIEPEVKKRLEKLYASFGLNISDAINMFIHQSLLVGGLPFELKNPGFKGEMAVENADFKEEPVELSIEDLRALIVPIAKKYELKSLYLIGSRARGDNRPDSDYDFCYEMKRPSLMRSGGLLAELSKALKSEVDLVSRDAASKEFLDKISKDEVMIYEG